MGVGAAMTCYSPSRHYLSAGLVALLLAGFSGWVASHWAPAWVAAVLFVASSLILLGLAVRPAIRIGETHLAIGKRVILWDDIERLDRTSWISPLIVHITLADESRLLLIYPGDIDSGKSLLRQLRRCARGALIDGIPYKQFWGEMIHSSSDRRHLPSPKYQLLRPEDEAEVERLFQVLKTVGHLDRGSAEEK